MLQHSTSRPVLLYVLSPLWPCSDRAAAVGCSHKHLDAHHGLTQTLLNVATRLVCTGRAYDNDILVLKLILVLIFILFSSQNFLSYSVFWINDNSSFYIVFKDNFSFYII